MYAVLPIEETYINSPTRQDLLDTAYRILSKRPPIIETNIVGRPPSTPDEAALQEQKLKPDMPKISIDWNKIARAFSDSRATPQFYKLALDFLANILAYAAKYEGFIQGRMAQALQEQLLKLKEAGLNLDRENLGLRREELGLRGRALDLEERLTPYKEKLLLAQARAAEQLSRQRDVSPLISYWKNLNDALSVALEGYKTATDAQTKAAYLQQIHKLSRELNSVGRYILESAGVAIPPEPSIQEPVTQQSLTPQQSQSIINFSPFDETSYRLLEED